MANDKNLAGQASGNLAETPAVKNWSPPRIKHLNDVSETEVSTAGGGDAFGASG